MKFNFRKKRRNDIDPDEIFLDSKNLPSFNTQQFEGRLEKAIPKKSIYQLSVFFLFFIILFTYKVGKLQIVNGQKFFEKSENNTLIKHPVFAERGLIYDRNKVLLSWNTWDVGDINKLASTTRSYINEGGFGLLLGYVTSPKKDTSGYYWQESFIGKDGVEKTYNDNLTGKNGSRIIEVNVKGEVQSENIITPPVPGENLYLTIDSRIQKKMYDSIKNMAENSHFTGGAGIIMNITNGEIIAITSYPEYNPNILSKREDSKTINSYLTDKRRVFLNRAISGLYAPGSIVKPIFGYAALEEGVITPNKQILSNGSISLPNPYFPDKRSVFKDHGVFGYVDMKKAIAVSSDVYFYQIGGGFEGQKGIGISKINSYSNLFELTNKTGINISIEKEGVVPNPEWKSRVFKGDIWRVGDTYNSSIGQYGFQVTPISMVRSIAALASYGNLPTPYIKINENLPSKKIQINKKNMDIIFEGMRMAVTEGTAQALNLKSVKVAAKSGTAQVGYGNTNTNSWIVGFFPYENPMYSFAVLMERGPKNASGNSTRVMSEVLSFITEFAPEYIK